MTINGDNENLLLEKPSSAECSIFERPVFGLQERVVQTECAHRFHESCITDWIMRSNKCQKCNRAANIPNLVEAPTGQSLEPEKLVSLETVPKVHNTRGTSKTAANIGQGQLLDEAVGSPRINVNKQTVAGSNKKKARQKKDQAVGQTVRQKQPTRNGRLEYNSNVANIHYNRVFKEVKRIISSNVVLNDSIRENSAREMNNALSQSHSSGGDSRKFSRLPPEKVTHILEH